MRDHVYALALAGTGESILFTMTLLSISKNLWFLAKDEDFMAGSMMSFPPLWSQDTADFFHSLAGKGRAGGREGKVNDGEVGGT